MWLLDTSTFKLKEFWNELPRYAILPHRWEENEELSFGSIDGTQEGSTSRGYLKVVNFCEKARQRGIKYVWVDTCCIDKKSSAELSEAINSMYQYYRRATICYVYLHDTRKRADIGNASWFTRGWTLQELLAPSELHFFDSAWRSLGSRKSLAITIGRITGIPKKALLDFNPAAHNVVEKLSWFGQRQTSREEDCAYCLLGLFNINLPLLYGEGKRAFQRLQEEIMKVSIDGSIFLWQGSACDAFGMLAASPSCFSNLPQATKTMIATHTSLFYFPKGWSINNAGMTIEASIHPYFLLGDFQGIYALILHRPHSFQHVPGFVIFICQDDTRSERPVFERVTVNGNAGTFSLERRLKTYLPFGHETVELTLARQPLYDFKIGETETRSHIVSFSSDGLVYCAAYKRPIKDPDAVLRSWQSVQKPSNGALKTSFSIEARRATGLHGYLLLTLPDDVQILICLGLDRRLEPLFIMLPLSKSIRDLGLNAARLLRTYQQLVYDKNGHIDRLDPELHMLCLYGQDRCLETDTELGLCMETEV